MIGVISDTHGLLRPQAVEALRGAELIIHAGDIGSEDILDKLRDIAPVVAVRGNNDAGPWTESLADIEVVHVDPHRIYVLHDLNALSIDPRSGGVNIVIAGHSHKPLIEQRDDVLYVNPGSAGPRRFTLPIAVARLHLGTPPLRAEIVELRE
jgi:putative phosphoesterase